MSSAISAETAIAGWQPLRRRFSWAVGLTALGLLALVGTASADETASANGPTVVPLLDAITYGDGVPLAYPSGKPEVTARLIEIKPGVETNHHRHPVPLFAYILEGELTLHDERGGIRKVKAGDAFMESSGWHFGRNEGSETVRLLAVYLGEQGTPLSVQKSD